MQATLSALMPAHAVLLADLQRAGVTDILADDAFNWLTAAKEQAVAQPAATPQPRTKSAPASQPATPKTPELPPVILPEANNCLQLNGTADQALLVTGALYDQLDQPFSSDEYTLLTRMLAAIGIDIARTATLACAVADAHSTPYPADFLTTLTPLAAQHITTAQAPAVLMLGQVAAGVVRGSGQRLSTAREETQGGAWDENAALAVTYHPRHLLKQPSLKRLAWQDLLSFQQRLQRRHV